jgi:hypothetical protein
MTSLDLALVSWNGTLDRVGSDLWAELPCASQLTARDVGRHVHLRIHDWTPRFDDEGLSSGTGALEIRATHHLDGRSCDGQRMGRSAPEKHPEHGQAGDDCDEHPPSLAPLE